MKKFIKKLKYAVYRDGIYIIWRCIFKILFFVPVRLLPHTNWANKYYDWMTHVCATGVIPKSNTFYGELLKVRTSGSLRSPERAFTTDKEMVKLYIKSIVGEKYTVPTLLVLRSIADLHLEYLSYPCIMKPTHSSGKFLFLNSENDIDLEIMRDWLSENYYYSGREENYRYLTKKIIFEPIVFGDRNIEDIKIFCVDGKVKLAEVDSDRGTNHTCRLFDRDWNDTGCTIGYPLTDRIRKKPPMWDEMVLVAESLAAPFEFVRIDTYCNDETNNFFIGEITHCPGGSYNKFFSKHDRLKVDRILFSERYGLAKINS